MASFRIYFMNGRTGHIERFDEFEAASDALALERAEQHSEAAPLELWSGGRKLHRIDPLPQLAPGSLHSDPASRWRLSV